MKRIAQVKCENEAMINEFPELVTCQRRRAATVHKLRYTITEDGQGHELEYVLDGIVQLGGPIKDSGKYLSEDDSRPIVQEVRAQLRKAGFSVSANISENDPE